MNILRTMFVLGCCGFAALATAQEELVSFEIGGTISTDAGAPVANASLQLTFTRISLDPATASTDSRLVVNTDNAGRYLFRLNIDPDWSDFSLRITSTGLDARRFLTPPERALTDIIRNAISSGSFSAEINWVITGRPGWEKEAEELRRLGENSERGKLIKARGLPDRIKQFTRGNGQSGELWFYYRDGVVVRFIGDTRDRDFYFRPRNAASTIPFPS